MTQHKLWFKVAVLTALTMASYTQAQFDILVSPLTETSFQDNSACISYLNSTLAGFFLKLNRPINASSGILRIGNDVEDIINKKLTDLMLGCRGNSDRAPPTIATQMTKNGRNFYVDQLGIQKRDFKPRLKSEVENILKIDNLKAMLNSVMAAKIQQETLNKQQAQLLRDYHEEIRALEFNIDLVKQSQIHELTSDSNYQKKLKLTEIELANAPRRYANLKAQFDDITTKYCNCQKCKSYQKPNLAHYSGRSVFEAVNITTEDWTISP